MAKNTKKKGSKAGPSFLDQLGTTLVQAFDPAVGMADEARGAISGKGGPSLGDIVGQMVGHFPSSLQSGLNQINPGAAKRKAAAADPPPAAPTNPQLAGKPLGQVLDPMAMQLYFANTIAPMLASVNQGMQGISQQYGKGMQSMLSGPNAVALNPAYKGVLQSIIPTAQKDMSMQGLAGMASAAAGPGLDQLMQAVQDAGAAQKTAQGEYEKNLGALNYLGSMGLSPGQQPTTGMAAPAPPSFLTSQTGGLPGQPGQSAAGQQGSGLGGQVAAQTAAAIANATNPQNTQPGQSGQSQYTPY